MSPLSFSRILPLFAFLALGACSTAELNSAGARVATVRAPLGTECKPVGYLVGKGGGTFGGAWVSNEALIDYAMNDLRNKAAQRGATHVHIDPPQLGQGDGTTTTATATGTAYKCPASFVEPAAAVQPVAPAAKPAVPAAQAAVPAAQPAAPAPSAPPPAM